ncbi:MAG: hypothetical protein ACXW3O_02820 [Brevundimonas sp.]
MAGTDNIASEDPRNRAAEASPADPPQTWGEGADLLTRIIDSLPVGLIYFDHGGAGVAANRFARDVLDLPSADLTREAAAGRLARLGVPPATMGTGAQRSDISGEICIGHRLYATTAFVVEGAWGGGTVLRIEDVTEARAVEARFDEARRELLASEVDGGVAHEFNNLLSRVICLAEEIQDEADLRVVHERAETLIVTAERGAEIVRRHMACGGTAAAEVRAGVLKPPV